MFTIVQAMDAIEATNTIRRMFNTGSPWNQAVGQGADMRQLEEHYRKVHAEAEEQRIVRMKTSMFVPA